MTKTDCFLLFLFVSSTGEGGGGQIKGFKRLNCWRRHKKTCQVNGNVIFEENKRCEMTSVQFNDSSFLTVQRFETQKEKIFNGKEEIVKR
ncbi:hypothetical protein B9Z55_014101 [Caenorhabditis nigoni]|uniref:Uncharacterized protein n=1 Tax=Caenorhabditis nigoni TaxID=1611254 RepID=A0A2G5U4J7_9PELO|nr:hypothetical protein B9Z55_014101 [Caenorhabditis nigoni]